ncbi:MAG: LLM class flavin-dependent oxidoreductase [Nocardiopsaceae bacterium]|jgi:alkanesulfonate monooxygenase SsuD/methylene tetrahydromethanopterin reductase-like flavin-dependent oxidoreductase (luciferase family)|nr:LLM class flavin-dependent oxidoreductase [Nocardiopsaceae bacterium]
MTSNPFRFALQATPQDGDQWLATARQAEDLGFSSLLMPDGTQLLSPLPALALAAGATSSLHVGTWVLSSPLRPPRLAAWDAHTISVLTGGRFELGIGTGRPEALGQSERLLERPAPDGTQRRALVGQTIDELRRLDEDLHTPVLMAAAGPKAIALAAAKADIITVAVGPLATRDEVAAMVANARQAAGTRAGQLEFAAPLFAIGDEAPPWLARAIQVDYGTLVANDSLAILRGTPQEMADELQRRREVTGISYLSVNGAFAEQFAPVVELLAGR